MGYLNIFKSLVLSMTFCVAIVSSGGLNEEFTWTRINFETPSEDTISSRFSYGSSRGFRSKRPQRPQYANNGRNPITFEGPTSGVAVIGNVSENQSNNENIPVQLASGAFGYDYVNNIPMGLNVWKDKLFISIPRRRLGVPSTLNYVSLTSKQRHNVPLIPYPNWNINVYPDTSEDGNNLISVYRFAIDPCDRMWIIDTGILELPGNRTYVRPRHRLVVINLHNDQIIHTYDLPTNVVTSATTLSDVTVDVTKDTCDDAYAYFPDLAGYGVIVYSMKDNRSWRVNHNLFFLESMKGDFNIAGHYFQWNDGIFSIELSQVKRDGFRDMYFHSMSGTHQFKVSTRIMRNETLATRIYHGNDFTVVGDRGPQTQTSTAVIHIPTSVMFLALVSKNALGCWNINKPLNTISIVHRDDNKMIYPSDVRIVGDKVFVLSTTMPGFLYGRLNYDEINFRVWSNDISSAIKGTACDSRRTYL